jgi:hypothetical protein
MEISEVIEKLKINTNTGYLEVDRLRKYSLAGKFSKVFTRFFINKKNENINIIIPTLHSTLDIDFFILNQFYFDKDNRFFFLKPQLLIPRCITDTITFKEYTTIKNNYKHFTKPDGIKDSWGFAISEMPIEVDNLQQVVFIFKKTNDNFYHYSIPVLCPIPTTYF